MKIRYLVALLMIALMVGCATPKETTPTAPSTPPAAPSAPATPVQEPTTAPTETEPTQAPVSGDIVVTNAGFDPAEKTVEVGTTLAILSKEGNHKLTASGKSYPTTEEGTATQITFDKVGSVKIFDVFTKKSATIIVTEKAASDTVGQTAQ